MNLPEELQRLEGELLTLRRPGPRSELRDAVLKTVRRELGHASSRRLLRGGFWSFVAATAAAALLWANFSMSAANNTEWALPPRGARPTIRDTARRIRELLPEMTEDESMRHALLFPGASPFAAAPDTAHSANHDSPSHRKGAW